MPSPRQILRKNFAYWPGIDVVRVVDFRLRRSCEFSRLGRLQFEAIVAQLRLDAELRLRNQKL